MIINKNAYAKINLILDLSSRLHDGYHSIFTVMQSVSLHDTVSVDIIPEGGIVITCSDPSVPCSEANTCFKAAKQFCEYTEKPLRASIHIEKRIPSMAGLAGGSADAAAVIEALDCLYRTNLSLAEKCDIALSVGADVPFCLCGGTRLCLDKGQVMAELPPLKKLHVLIAKPAGGVSTKAAYESFDSLNDVLHPEKEIFLMKAAKGEYLSAFGNSLNVFEQAVKIAKGPQIKEAMYSHNAVYAAMSGSGSAFFGLFGDAIDAEECKREIAENVEFLGIYECTQCGVE